MRIDAALKITTAMNARIKIFTKKIAKAGLDSFLVTDPVNISYLTGFRNAEGRLLVSSSRKPTYFTNSIYAYEAKKNVLWDVKIITDNFFEKITQHASISRIKNIGFSSKSLTFFEYKKMNEFCARKHITLTPSDNIIEGMRAIKSHAEIARIRHAAEISRKAFSFIQEIITPQMSEVDMAVAIDQFLKLKGDYALAFETIVAFGSNSAIIHHQPKEARFGNKKIALIDLGAKYCGYCADLTRVFFLGTMPFYLQRIAETIRKAQEKAIEAVRDGVTADKVDAAARKYIEKKGFGKFFGHGTGHGIGMNVHEYPSLSPTSKAILKEGMVLTIEPGIYMPGKYGFRREDMIIVGTTHAEIINGDSGW